MRIDVLTLFPKIFDSYVDESLFSRARKSKLLSFYAHDLRDYLNGPKDRVDDRPFGGGPGMVIKAEPVYKAVAAAKKKAGKVKSRVILFSTRGAIFDAAAAKRLAKYKQLIFICGHYEGVDERVAEHIADEELSIGSYVLSGGEPATIVVMDAVSRQIKGFLGKHESLEEIKGSYPSYTRPASLEIGKGKKKATWKVPEALLNGNHKKINEWRSQI
jgi:tRNA (guanine37-N1)-methyltransferase